MPHCAQCGDSNIEGRRFDRFRAAVLRTAQRAILRRPRLEAIRGRDLCRNSLRGASVSTPSRLTSTTSGARRGGASSTFAVCLVIICNATMTLRESDLLLCRRAFLGDPYGLQIRLIIAILTALFAVAPANAQSGGEASGIWLTQAGDAKVRVSKCGGGICGVVVWLKDPINPATGKPQVDDRIPIRPSPDVP